MQYRHGHEEHVRFTYHWIGQHCGSLVSLDELVLLDCRCCKDLAGRFDGLTFCFFAMLLLIMRGLSILPRAYARQLSRNPTFYFHFRQLTLAASSVPCNLARKY